MDFVKCFWLTFFVFILFPLNNTYGQATIKKDIEKFQLISENPNLSISTLEFYKTSINSANLESFRYRTEPDTLQFDNGIKVVLYSAQSLKNKGMDIDPFIYLNSVEMKQQNPHYNKPNFALTKDGKLMAQYTSYSKN